MGAVAIKSALSNIPSVGGSLGEILGLAIASRLAERRDGWLESLARRLLELQEKVEGCRVENSASDEQFVSTVVQASAAALATHHEGKLEALRNAVSNTALKNLHRGD